MLRKWRAETESNKKGKWAVGYQQRGRGTGKVPKGSAAVVVGEEVAVVTGQAAAAPDTPGPAMSVHVVRTSASTVTVTQDSGTIDRGYLRTVQAMLKVIQMVCLLIGFLCVQCSHWTDYTAYSYFVVVSLYDLIVIFIFFLVYVFRLYRLMTCLSWPLAELIHYIIGTLLLFIASIVAITKSYGLSALVAGGVFGLIVCVLCCVSMWSSYKVSFVTQSTSSTA